MCWFTVSVARTFGQDDSTRKQNKEGVEKEEIEFAMDWKEIINLKPEKINEENRDAVFEGIVGWENIERVDNKTYKRLFKISHQLMKWKRDQVSRSS